MNSSPRSPLVVLTTVAVLAFVASCEPGSSEPATPATPPPAIEPLPTFAADPVGPRKTQPVAADVAKFIPEDAEFFAYVARPNQLIESVRGLVAEIRPGTEGLIDTDTGLRQLGLEVRSRELDLDAPLGFTGTSAHGPLAVLAAQDPEDLVDLFDGATARSGQHIAVALGIGTPAPSAEPHAITRDFAAGDLVVRLDLEKLQDDIAEMRARFEHMAEHIPDAAVVLAVYRPMFRMLESATGFVDVTIDIAGDALHLSASHDTGRSTGNEPTYRTPELFTKLHSGPSAITFASNADLTRIYDVIDFDAFAAAIPAGGEREELRKAYQSQVEIYRACAGPMAGALELTESGVRGTFLLVTDNPAEAAATLSDNIDALQALFNGSGVQTESVAHNGSSFALHEFELDVERMMRQAGAQAGTGVADTERLIRILYGERMRIGFGQIQDTTVITLGEDAEGICRVIDRFAAGTDPDATALAVLASDQGAAGSDPIMMMNLDPIRILRSAAEIHPEILEDLRLPAIPDDIAAPASFVVSSRGGRYRFDMTMKLGDLSRLFGR